MKAFLNVFKFKIKTVCQGLAISNDETPMSKALSTGALKVVKNNNSCLDKIKTWNDFDHSETVIRETLLKELQDFSTSHQQ